MANVQQEAEKIRILLEQWLPGMGGGMVTAEAIVAAMAATALQLSLRGAADPNTQALHVPALPGDVYTLVTVGDYNAAAPGILVQSAATALQAASSGAPAVLASSEGSYAIWAQNQNAAPAVQAENLVDGPALRAQMSGYDYAAKVENNGPGPGLFVKSGNEDAGIAVEAAGFGVQINAQYGIALYARSFGGENPAARYGVVGQGAIGVGANGDVVGVEAYSQTGVPLRVQRGTTVAGETGIEFWDGSAWKAIKIGASGTGPGGSGRMLYID